MGVLLTIFGLHVYMLAVEVILSLIIFGLLVYAYRSKNKFFKEEARSFMGYIALTYASMHFFLTATTVILLSFFPEFLVFAGRSLFYVFGFIGLILTIRLAAIAWVWYAWDTLSERRHMVFSGIFALAGVLWVFLDMFLLAFMNTPIGVVTADPLIMDYGQVLLNPTAYTLLLVVVTGAAMLTFNLLAHAYTYRNLDNHVLHNNILANLLKVGIVSLLLFVLTLIGYLVSLYTHSPLKLSNMLGMDLNGAEVTANLLWVTALGVGIVLVVLGIAIFVLRSSQADFLAPSATRLIRINGILTSLGFMGVILLNLLSQAPYFIADPDFVASSNLDFLIVNESLNQYAAIVDVYTIMIFGFVPLFFAFGVLLYFLFSGRINGSYEYHGKVAAEI